MKLSRRKENFLLASIISLTLLIFMRPFSYYLFGQDSISFFGVFNYYLNPLYSFNSGIEMTYFSLLTHFLTVISGNPAISQRETLLILTAVSGVGLLYLLDTLLPIENTKVRVLGKAIALMLFLYNPFTLSVVWAHILGWTFLYLFSPVLIYFLSYSLKNKFDLLHFSESVLLSFLFAPGISGDFLPFYLFVIFVFILFALFEAAINLQRKGSIRRPLIALLSFAGFATLTSLWTFIPMYFQTFSTVSQGFTGNNLIAFFKSESIETTLPHVISLMGYNLIYTVPSMYPWIPYSNILQEAGYAIFLILPFSLVMMKRHKITRPIGIIAFGSIIFSTGANFPFSSLNTFLINLRGPFYFLANAYYFTLQFYVLFLVVLFYYVITYFTSSLAKNHLEWSKIKIKTYPMKIRNVIRNNYKPVVVILFIFFIFVTFLYPFASNSVYQKNGSNIDEINLGNNLWDLRSKLDSNFNGTPYLTLLIPTSSLVGSSYLEYNNNTFADSKGIFNSIDPYPLVWRDNSHLATSIENYLSSGNLRNINGVLQFLHIKYVIFTFNYDTSKYQMDHSPNGGLYNFTDIFDNLQKSIGPPMYFGEYYLFTVSDVTPSVGVINNPIFSNVSLSTYLDLLGGLNQSKNILSQNPFWNNVIPDSNYTISTATITIYDPSRSYMLPSNNTLLELANGSVIRPVSIENEATSGFFQISPIVISNIANTSSYYTNMTLENGSLSSNYSSFISFPNSFNSNALLFFSLSLQNISFHNRNFFDFSFGNDSISLEFINTSKSENRMILQTTSNFTNKTPYGWNNINLPIDSFGKKINLHVEVLRNYTLNINLTVPALSFNDSVYFYFGESNYKNNPGSNAQNLPKLFIIPSNFTFSFYSGGAFPTRISNFSVSHFAPIKYIMVFTTSNTSASVATRVKTTFFGDYSLKLSKSENDSYLFFFSPSKQGWVSSFAGCASYRPLISNNFIEVYGVLPESMTSVSLYYQSFSPVFFMMSVLELAILGFTTIVFITKEFRKRS